MKEREKGGEWIRREARARGGLPRPDERTLAEKQRDAWQRQLLKGGRGWYPAGAETEERLGAILRRLALLEGRAEEMMEWKEARDCLVAMGRFEYMRIMVQEREKSMVMAERGEPVNEGPIETDLVAIEKMTREELEALASRVPNYPGKDYSAGKTEQ